MDEILVAVDGSHHSVKVVDYAINLAKSLSSEILLVSAVQLPSKEPESIAAFERAEHYLDAFSEYLEFVGASVINKLTERLRDAGVRSRSVVPSGNAASEIVEIAERKT